MILPQKPTAAGATLQSLKATEHTTASDHFSNQEHIQATQNNTENPTEL